MPKVRCNQPIRMNALRGRFVAAKKPKKQLRAKKIILSVNDLRSTPNRIIKKMSADILRKTLIRWKKEQIKQDLLQEVYDQGYSKGYEKCQTDMFLGNYARIGLHQAFQPQQTYLPSQAALQPPPPPLFANNLAQQVVQPTQSTQTRPLPEQSSSTQNPQSIIQQPQANARAPLMNPFLMNPSFRSATVQFGSFPAINPFASLNQPGARQQPPSSDDDDVASYSGSYNMPGSSNQLGMQQFMPDADQSHAINSVQSPQRNNNSYFGQSNSM